MVGGHEFANRVAVHGRVDLLRVASREKARVESRERKQKGFQNKLFILIGERSFTTVLESPAMLETRARIRLACAVC